MKVIDLSKLLVATVGACLVLTACGGDSETASESVFEIEGDSEQVDEVQSDEDAALEFTQCARDKGFDIDDPGVDSEGNIDLQGAVLSVESAEARLEIIDACGDIMADTELAASQQDQLNDTAFQDQLLEMAQCLRDNGVDASDPNFAALATAGSGGAQMIFGDSFDVDDPQTQEIAEDCAQQVGLGLPGS